MTSKDNTGDKLVASMRKSKTGTVTQKTGERSASAGTAVAGTTASKKAATKAALTANAKAKKKPVPAPEQAGGFSHGRRVWPD